MKKFILAKKIGMSQIFDNNGGVVPVTLVEAGPCVITQVKTIEKDGYESAQLGFGQAKKLNKARKGHLKNLGDFKYLVEFKGKDGAVVGDRVDVSIFAEGDKVKVSGISKGKGYAGVVKRHGFRGGPASHGQKDRLRAPGSIGMSFPERVPKGRRMAGRMGGERVSVKNLVIAAIDRENNILALQGAVPGNKNSLLEITSK